MSSMAQPPAEEGKLLSEALNTVKIQVQQMKRYLVRINVSCNTNVETGINDMLS
jgi:hypothetical protein